MIPAAFITGIRSDLSGQITAQVTQRIYDSPTRVMPLARSKRPDMSETHSPHQCAARS